MTGPRAGIGGMTGAALLVVGTYCLGTLGALGTLCILAIRDQAVPDQLDTIVTTMVAGVGLLLAKTWAEAPASGPVPAQPVVIDQPDGDPVPVVEAPAPKRMRGRAQREDDERAARLAEDPEV